MRKIALSGLLVLLMVLFSSCKTDIFSDENSIVKNDDSKLSDAEIVLESNVLNPVDSAFERVSMQLTAEQRNSEIYAYLLAAQWDEELEHLYRKYYEVGRSFYMSTYPYTQYVWDHVELQSHLVDQPLSVTEQFLEFADHYRNQTFFIREKYKAIGHEVEFSTDEDELFSKLIDFSYEKNYTDLFRSYPALIGSIPEEEIFMFGFHPFGILLEVKGQEKLMNWVHPPENRKWPELMVCDLDEDGAEELVVSMFYVSGSSVNKQSLHVVNLSEQTLFEEHELDYGQCANIVLKALSMEYSPSSQTVKVLLNDQALALQIPENLSEYAGNYELSSGFSSIFNFDGEQVSVSLHFGIFRSDFQMPVLDFDISADVVYTGSEFELANMQFETNER